MSEDLHEKIGELRGEIKGLSIQQEQLRENIIKVFDKMDSNTEKLTVAINASKNRDCKKEDELERLASNCETVIKQTARIHDETKPLLHEYDKRQQSKANQLYARTEVKIGLVLLFVAFLTDSAWTVWQWVVALIKSMKG